MFFHRTWLTPTLALALAIISSTMGSPIGIKNRDTALNTLHARAPMLSSEQTSWIEKLINEQRRYDDPPQLVEEARKELIAMAQGKIAAGLSHKTEEIVTPKRVRLALDEQREPLLAAGLVQMSPVLMRTSTFRNSPNYLRLTYFPPEFVNKHPELLDHHKNSMKAHDPEYKEEEDTVLEAYKNHAAMTGAAAAN
ncbi:hypothetical protein FRB96_008650 [Tulasnella sp. 330]|nr:hypothetical protein FRB96_008650 [Tulasnella sp. 330]